VSIGTQRPDLRRGVLDTVLAPPPGPVVTACVSENQERWFRMVLMQAVSIRNLGGSLATSPHRTYFVHGLGETERALLEELGSEVVSVEPFPSPIPHANKLRMFEAHAAEGEGTLIALDSDVVVLGDLGAEVNPQALRGLVGGYSPFDDELWGAWLEERGLPRPSRGYEQLRIGREMPVPYLCSGVLLVPKRYCKALADSWAKQILALIERFDAPPGAGVGPELPADARFFTDQLALACAIIEAEIPVEPLPVGCNFRPGLGTLGLVGIGHVHPIRAVHYHSWGMRPDRFIKPVRFLPLNPDLERVNRLTAAHLGVEYESFQKAASRERRERLLATPAELRRRAPSAVRARLVRARTVAGR